MSTEIAKLDVVERKELRKLESVIEKGMATFVEVGRALKEVRDNKLYRESHKTFEKYVTDRWMIKRSYAYDLIASSEVVENVRNSGQIEGPKNAGQAAELARADPEEQAEIWEDVVDEHEEPTAKDVREAVDRRKADRDEEPESESPAKSNEKPIDEAADRARRKIPELIRSLRLQLDNLGLNFDRQLNTIEEAAR